uniref:Uncharacterized protein LOC114327212 n=1 Tax=Diabrotica virgifera virgifera TaxID=50390 RepID=A0A6P7F9T3_DIAVI
MCKAAPKGWGLGKSQRGWMTAECLFEYFSNVFVRYLKESLKIYIQTLLRKNMKTGRKLVAVKTMLTSWNQNNKILKCSVPMISNWETLCLQDLSNWVKDRRQHINMLPKIIDVLSSEEYEIQCFKSANEEKTVFCPIENNVCSIDKNDILGKLPDPIVQEQGRKFKTIFPGKLNIYEQI